ncbi:MAG: glycosyltransferase family 39 protein [Acidobacteria bacterium]|nr:glycosyltransferase family 39 protein [Acidobacteriota bacterium]
MNDPDKTASPSAKWLGPLAIGAGFAVVKLLLHFAFNSNYGYFRDELYFLACGEHLAWGYPDHAPLVALVAKTSRLLLGDSLFAIRFFPAVAGALKVFLTALLVREFGGKTFAALLACLCVLGAPVYLAIDNLLSMNPLEPVFWTLCVYFAVRAVKETPSVDETAEIRNPKSEIRNPSLNWLFFGLFAGLGLMNKHSMVFFGFALVAGLLATKARKAFLDKYFWMGGALAFVIFLPNVVWQFQHDFATLELLQNVQKTGKNVVLSPWQFVVSQIMALLPVTLPVWLAGLWYFLGDRRGRRFRFLGVAYLVLLALMIFLKAKDYYLVPVYPMLLAGGAVFFEDLFEKARRLRFVKYVLPVPIAVLAALVAPVVVPVLPVETLIKYQEAIGFKPPKSEVAHDSPLQQIFGDQFGWPEMVAKVADVYDALPPDERAKAGIYASNYGEAGAIDFFGPRYGLPKAISPHQSYFLWGSRDYTGEILIVLGASKEDAEKKLRIGRRKNRGRASLFRQLRKIPHPRLPPDEKAARGNLAGLKALELRRFRIADFGFRIGSGRKVSAFFRLQH